MGESLTGMTIWVALALYAASQFFRGHPQAGTGRAGLWLLGIGLACYVGHVVSAFESHYAWSHTVAYRQTAAQTKALLGWASGSGLYLNYLFGLAWFTEVCWWTKTPEGYLRRPAWLELTARCFFLFMILNGAVIFVDTPKRWMGVVLVVVLAIAWRRAKHGRN